MKFKEFVKTNISLFALITYIFFGFAFVAKLISGMSAAFADFFNRHISSITRAIFSYTTSVVPFSIAETVVICAIPIAVLVTALLIKKIMSAKAPWRVFFNLLGFILLLASFFIINFGIAYNCTPIEEKINLDRNITTDDLTDACFIAMDEVDALEKYIVRDISGASIMPYSFDTMVKKLNESYEKLYAEYNFISPLNVRAKQIALSKPMTYTHISGVYTYFTGEANINMNYLPYIVVFSTAHEMAHQRGIAPEDEANFIAFLVCVNSDDEYIRYCGYAEMLQYFTSSLYGASIDKYISVVSCLPTGLLYEYSAFSEMFAPYSGSTASKVSGAVNDTYLKMQGEAEGTASYDLVTSLATAYLVKKEK